MKAHPDFKEKYSENTDAQNRDIAFKKIFDDVMAKQRKNELDLYRLIAQDESFKTSMQETLKRILKSA
jgi:type I restriction enzyme R subunit